MSKRFYLPAEEIHGREAVLRGKEAHHVTRVMRRKVGETITLFDGKGHEYQGVILKILKQEVALSLERRTEQNQKGIVLHVACALPKNLRMERLIEKLTEVGTDAIFPFVSERTVPRVTKDREIEKLIRFRRIAAEAAKQCGLSRLPEISKISSFSEVLGLASSYDLSLFLTPQAPPLRELLQKEEAKRVVIAIGPEGGWSQEEVERARENGWKLVSLGDRILKVDTACVAIAAILHYMLDRVD